MLFSYPAPFFAVVVIAFAIYEGLAPLKAILSSEEGAGKAWLTPLWGDIFPEEGWVTGMEEVAVVRFEWKEALFKVVVFTVKKFGV